MAGTSLTVICRPEFLTRFKHDPKILCNGGEIYLACHGHKLLVCERGFLTSSNRELSVGLSRVGV